MGFVIGAIVVVLCILLVGYFTRKKYYKEIDRLESWKIDITNRPVQDEMSKVKQLNMTGQTEELFERWRKEWDEIAAGGLPEIDELLFDAEEAIDKLRFKKAGEIQAEIRASLTESEEKIKQILTELNELVGSEQKNREEMEELKDVYRESKRSLLAHRHTYGHAVDAFEKQLDEMMENFQIFEEKTEHGDYLEAREVVLTIKERLMKISEKMEAIPKLLMDCQTGLPMQINELKDGFHEMIGQGYRLEHLRFEQEIVRLEQEIQSFLAQLGQTEVEEVETGIAVVKETIEQLYVLLEKEVLAKHYIQQNKDEIKAALNEIEDNCRILKEETEYVQQIYHLAKTELDAQKQSEKQVVQLLKRYEHLEIRISEQGDAHSHLSEELSEIKQMIETIATEQKEYREALHMLRKDEIIARDKVKELKKKMAEAIRTVSKSKIPGLPREYEFLLEDAEESINRVIEKLAEKPLNIPTVQHFLDLAVQSVEELVKNTDEMLENVLLAEKVIQYGNRFKSRYPSVAEGLNEAELAFRDYDYKLALEQAATTIEKVEPGAMKKIEALMSEKVL
ncbi:septation ring formation regulator EzrA [Neobacillus sp. LXY-4]|uniref:septation ring formation regulator EzrA n=1 Tax=Neobacillus sp. LXY-4 TaxID=3379826 RepID=UPI003EE10FF1